MKLLHCKYLLSLSIYYLLFPISIQKILAGPPVYVGQKCNQENRVSMAKVDHSAYDKLLQKYVDNQGNVAYGSWKKNVDEMKALDAYLAHLGCVDFKKPATKAAQLAYWINAYNAVTIKGILREYPTTSIRNHTPRIGYNIWKDLKLWVNNYAYSLDFMEHKIVRKMGEPRIHFALVCASKGCPPLVNRAYTAENLEKMLVFNARRFFSQRKNFYTNPSTRTVYISKLIDWYGSDFAKGTTKQIRALLPYFPKDQDLSFVRNSNFNVHFLNYDWKLNDQKAK